MLIADWEDTIEETLRRVYQLARGMGLQKPPEGSYYVSLARSINHLSLAVRDEVKRLGIDLLIADSFGLASEGQTELSKDAIEGLKAFRRLGCAVLLLDHTPKAGPQTQYGVCL